jgi:hypothetical protein
MKRRTQREALELAVLLGVWLGLHLADERKKN